MTDARFAGWSEYLGVRHKEGETPAQGGQCVNLPYQRLGGWDISRGSICVDERDGVDLTPVIYWLVVLLSILLKK